MRGFDYAHMYLTYSLDRVLVKVSLQLEVFEILFLLGNLPVDLLHVSSLRLTHAVS